MVRIITDSAVDFEPQEFTEKRIGCIPITVIFGEEEYKENIDLSKEKFYELLKASEELPRTAQPSPHALMEFIEEAEEAGDELIYITLSSSLSGTYQSAAAMKELSGYEKCYIVDGLNATGGQRMIVEYAAKLRDEGKTAEEIIAGIESIRSRVVLYACMDTLEYLYKGGRISNTVYKLGSFAHIKPIISVDKTGSVAVPAKAMGMTKGMEYLCKCVEKQPPDNDFPFYVMYTDDREKGKALRDKIKNLGIEVPDERIIPVGAAIGSHIGPAACGMVYIGK